LRTRTISLELDPNKEKFYGGKLYQYDHGVILEVSGLNTQTGHMPQFQFSNNNLETAYEALPTTIGAMYQVQIPDVILMYPRNFVCYVYWEGTESDPYGITTMVIDFTIVPRQRPNGGDYTPEQIDNYDKLVSQAVNEKGYMDFYINDDGHLIYRHTDKIQVDFEISNGRLIAIWPATT